MMWLDTKKIVDKMLDYIDRNLDSSKIEFSDEANEWYLITFLNNSFSSNLVNGIFSYCRVLHMKNALLYEFQVKPVNFNRINVLIFIRKEIEIPDT